MNARERRALSRALLHESFAEHLRARAIAKTVEQLRELTWSMTRAQLREGLRQAQAEDLYWVVRVLAEALERPWWTFRRAERRAA